MAASAVYPEGIAAAAGAIRHARALFITAGAGMGGESARDAREREPR